MMDGKVRIGLVQMKMSAGKGKNIAKAIWLIKKAAQKKAQIICLPELFNTLYFAQREHSDAKKFAEPILGKTTKTMLGLSKELGVAIIVPIYEKSGSKYYNTIAVVEDGKLLGKYRKMHIPHDPLFYEKNYFAEGNLGFKVIKTKHAKIAPLICFDQWFPEAARIAALKGADIIFYPTAIGWIKGYKAPDNWLDSWITIQRSHAIANGIHVAAVNRAGVEGKLDFWGNSFVADSFGKVLKNAGAKEDAVVVDIDLGNNKRIREGWGFLRNRRAENYSGLSKRSIDMEKKNGMNPLSLDYYFPAEWEKHEAVFTGWPYDKITFPQTEAVEHDFAEIIKTLQETKGEKVKLFVRDKKMRERAGKILREHKVDTGKIEFLTHDYADVWLRDSAPTFVVNRSKKKIAMVQWEFNAWGNKFKELLKDRHIPAAINKRMKLQLFRPGFFNEGGAIETNGNGTILTTKSCLLNPNRNPSIAPGLADEILKHYLGSRNIIWLEKGFKEDHTDGHIDNLARFVNADTILCSFETNKKDNNYTALKNNYGVLKNALDENGKKFTVIKLPVPKIFDEKGERLCASYTNFYIANNAVLVPIFKVKTDGAALKIISRSFRGRKIVPIDCSRIVYGGGTLHCITQQEPAP